MIQKYKWLFVALTAIALLAIGFFIGRANQKTIVKTETKYVKGETVRDSFSYPVPYEVVKVVPDFRYLPSKKDTLWKDKNIYVIEKIDTAKIIEQFSYENKYRQTLFDNDSNGKLIVKTSVQYNKQKSIKYTFTPIQKVTTFTKEKKNVVTPFLSVSHTRMGDVRLYGAGGGLYFKNVGVGGKYVVDEKKNKGFEINLNYKF